MPVVQIVALTGLGDPTVRKAVDLFTAGGWLALKRTYEQRPEAMQQQCPAIEPKSVG